MVQPYTITLGHGIWLSLQSWVYYAKLKQFPTFFVFLFVHAFTRKKRTIQKERQLQKIINKTLHKTDLHFRQISEVSRSCKGNNNGTA